jgi:hypothetical protein
VSDSPLVPWPDEKSSKNRYNQVQRQIAVAAFRRYGGRAARRALDDIWEHVPSEGTLKRWAQDGRFEPEEQDLELWAKAEGGRRARLQQFIADRFETTLEAYDHFVEDRDASAMRSAAIAAGIFYDKLVPPARGGTQVPITVGEGGKVQMMVVAPSALPGGVRPMMEDEDDLSPPP